MLSLNRCETNRILVTITSSAKSMDLANSCRDYHQLTTAPCAPQTQI